MSNTSIDDTTPDELMEHFQGRSLKSIILFTIVVHAILLLGTSAPFLWKTFFGADKAGLTEEERVELAVKEATASLREIAENHGLKAQDLSSQFASGAPRTPKTTPTPKAEPAPPADDGTTNDSGEPKSAIEKELDKKATGPAMPPVEDDEEDLFK